MSDNKKRKFPFLKITGILFVLLICGAASYFGVMYLQNREKPSCVTKLTHADLKAEVIVFVFEKLPHSYNNLFTLNTRITLIDNEIERLKAIEKEFPEQARITRAETKVWQNLRKRLAGALKQLGKNVETLYVAYLVNTEKGLEQIERTKENLKKTVADILDSTDESTCKLKKPETDKGIPGKIKKLFLELKERFMPV